jgi:hypothetical protein
VIGPDGEFERMERVTADLPDPPAISFDMSTLVTPETMLSWPQPFHSEDENVGEIERRRTDYMLVGLDDGTVENLGSFPQAIARVLADGCRARTASGTTWPSPDRIRAGADRGCRTASSA